VKPSRLLVVDTNVVVAGLLTSQQGAPTARILDAMISGKLRFALSIELLAEYRAALLRPQIRRRHGLDEGEIDVVLEALARNAVVVARKGRMREAPDPGDQRTPPSSRVTSFSEAGRPRT
jgi:putative PIN family toxin of toxin-antitoxin system